MTQPFQPAPEPQFPAKTAERSGWLAQIDTRGGSNLPTSWEPEGIASAYQVAALVARSGLAPKGLQDKPQDILLVLWHGKEMGLSAMQSLSQLYAIHGRVTQAAELMRARCLQRPDICLRFAVVEASDTSATVETQRAGDELRRTTFTIEQAKKAGLTERDDNWRKYPEDKLVARATSRAARRYFPDILGPVVYTPEEIEESTREERNVTPGAPVQPPEIATRAAEAVVEATSRRVIVREPLEGAGKKGDDPITIEEVRGPAVRFEDVPADDPRVVAAREIVSGNTRTVAEQQAEEEKIQGVRDALAADRAAMEERIAAAKPTQPEPKEYQPLLDMRIPQVGDKVAATLWQAGIRTPQAMVEAGVEGLTKHRAIGKLTAQGIVLWAEKQVDPEPDWKPTPKKEEPPLPPPFDDAPLADETGKPVVNDPMDIPFPGQEPGPPRRQSPPAPMRTAADEGLPPGIAPPKKVGKPLRPFEINSLERVLLPKLGNGPAMTWLKDFALRTFGVPLEGVDAGYFAALYEACEAAPDPNPDTIRLRWLRARGEIA